MNNSADECEKLNWSGICSQLDEEKQSRIKRSTVVDCISSTNDWAMVQFKQNKVPAVCFAEQQTKGRGRNGREWVSPKGQNIYMSLAWPFGLKVADLHGLSLAVGVAIVRLLNHYQIKAQLKWPNDVLVDGRKIAGVLLESRIRENKSISVVIGVGLNVSMRNDQAGQINQRWTSMQAEIKLAKTSGRNQIAAALLSRLINVCEEYAKHGFSIYKDEWQSYDICKKARLKVTTADGIVYGKGLGVDDGGALRVQVDGRENIFHAADVSVRVD
jgi:BirA family transcriptional regulator, biotin operon repressor / biotin---[acetyl-CoA-carboxylase] ligase